MGDGQEDSDDGYEAMGKGLFFVPYRLSPRARYLKNAMRKATTATRVMKMAMQ